MARLVLSIFEIRRLQQALGLAVDYTASLIDAHRTGLIRRDGLRDRFVPAEHRNDVRRWQKDIGAFQQLARKLKNGAIQ